MAETFRSFDAPDGSGQLRAENASVGGFVREPPQERLSERLSSMVRWCKVPRFEKESIAEDDGSVKGQSRFGTVPADEFVDGVASQCVAMDHVGGLLAAGNMVPDADGLEACFGPAPVLPTIHSERLNSMMNTRKCRLIFGWPFQTTICGAFLD